MPAIGMARMNEQPLNQNNETDVAALPARPLPPFRPAQSRRLCNAQLALPAAPRRQRCRSSQSLRGALLAGVGSALLLAGCAIGPNYKRPAVDSPANFRNAPAEPATNSLADMQWW